MRTQMFIAAGGNGRRLGVHTRNKPKSLIGINGRPIIDHIICAGREAKVDDIVIGVDGGKELLQQHVRKFGVEFESDCVEPLTKAFFRSAKIRGSDIIIGTNGDTIYRHESLNRVLSALGKDTEAAAAVLVTKITRPIFSSFWTYWRYEIEDREVKLMSEVPGHEIPTEYVVSAFRVSALKELSQGFRNEFCNPKLLPFKCYSLGWDYLLKLLLWKKYKVIGIIGDDLSLNINYSRDLIEGKYFFTNPGYFRWLRTTPNGLSEPLLQERAIVAIKPKAIIMGLFPRLKSEFEKFELCIISESVHKFNYELAASWYREHIGKPWFSESIRLITMGELSAFIVEGKGAFYKALCWKRAMRDLFALSRTDNLVHSTFSRYSFEEEMAREMSILNLSIIS